MSNFISTHKSMLVLLLPLFLISCAQTPSNDPRKSVFVTDERNDDGSQNVESVENPNDSASSEQELVDIKEFNYAELALPELTSSQLNLSDEKVLTVAFDGVPFEYFLEQSLANMLQVDFILDPQVNLGDEEVTLKLSEKVSTAEYLEIFKKLLDSYELSMSVDNKVVFIQGKSRRTGLPVYDFGIGRSADSVPIGSAPVFQLVPIDFIDKDSMGSFIVRLTNASPVPLKDPNLLGIRGRREDVVRALDVVTMIDRPSIRGSNVRIFKLDFVPSARFIEQVTELLTNDGINVATSVNFTDLTRLNSVVVHTNNLSLVSRISEWIDVLDTPESTSDRQYFLYYPENMEAQKLADVLTKLNSQGTRSGATGSGAAGSGATGAASTSGISAAASAQTMFGELSFVVDENRNVIIILSDAATYNSILPLLKKLDVAPTQVLIEARLIEVTLTDQFSQGIDWSYFSGQAARNVDRSSIASLSGGSFSYTVSGVNFDVALSLLQNTDKLKVLSSPRIVVANGETANINVGTEIPVLSTQSADVDSQRVLQSIQYRSTGVDLSVTPVVNSTNVVALKISQNVSETSENASSGIDSPIILNRSFNTSVIANSGQSLILGGLIRENNSSGTSSVPMLGDIPLIKGLFGSESRSKTRTELIVIITPRVITNKSDILELNDIFLNEMTLHD